MGIDYIPFYNKNDPKNAIFANKTGGIFCKIGENHIEINPNKVCLFQGALYIDENLNIVKLNVVERIIYYITFGWSRPEINANKVTHSLKNINKEKYNDDDLLKIKCVVKKIFDDLAPTIERYLASQDFKCAFDMIAQIQDAKQKKEKVSKSASLLFGEREISKLKIDELKELQAVICQECKSYFFDALLELYDAEFHKKRKDDECREVIELIQYITSFSSSFRDNIEYIFSNFCSSNSIKWSKIFIDTIIKNGYAEKKELTSLFRILVTNRLNKDNIAFLNIADILNEIQCMDGLKYLHVIDALYNYTGALSKDNVSLSH